MEEVQSNQDNPTLGGFTDKINGAMFGNHGEMELGRVGSSSPQTGRGVPMIVRRPSNTQVALYDMAMLGSNQLGVGFLGNDNLLDGQSLSSAFKIMSLNFRDGAAVTRANSGIVPSRNGYYPEDIVIPSANSTVNTFQQLTAAQDGFMPSSMKINGVEHMKPKYSGRNFPMYTGMNGSDNISGASCDLRSAAPSQQQFFIDERSQAFASYQQMGSNFRWQDIDAERYPLVQSQDAYQQMQQVAGSDVCWSMSNQHGAIHSSSMAAASPYHVTPSFDQLGHGSADIYWNSAIIPNGNNHLGSTLVNNCPSINYPDCSCGYCEYCQIQQAEKFKHQHGLRCSSKGFFQHQILDKVNLKSSPENILMKPEGVNSIRNIKSGFELNGCSQTNRRIKRHGYKHHLNIQSNDTLRFDWQSSQSLSSLESEYDLVMKTQLKFSSVDEVVGNIYLLAKDQNGCRFLQRIFTEGAPEDVKKVFDGIIEHIGELMVDPFGNYLVQKLLEECNNDQKMHMIYEITKRPGQLIKVSCNMHGTRVVQKVIETINTLDEVSMVVSALSPGAVPLMMDANGSHVAQRCLQKLSPEYKAFLLNAAIEYYFELGQDRHGCCIIQKCIVHANKEQKNQLLYNITSRALDLSEHQYGNYVIQYIIDLNIIWATDVILDKLEGHYGYLSMQKCSSNVVEKCLKEAQEPKRVNIIHELINDPKLQHILLDQYGNYVIQTALRQCEDVAVRATLIGAIRPHAAALRNNMFGKRILSRTFLKNRKY